MTGQNYTKVLQSKENNNDTHIYEYITTKYHQQSKTCKDV